MEQGIAADCLYLLMKVLMTIAMAAGTATDFMLCEMFYDMAFYNCARELRGSSAQYALFCWRYTLGRIMEWPMQH